MIFSNLSPIGDWTFGQGLGNYIGGNDAIGINIKTRLLSWVGDCFFDLTAGIDWANRLSDLNQKALLELDLRRNILQAEGVTAINSISFSVNNNKRTFNAQYDVSTIFTQSYVNTVTQDL